MSHTCIPWSQFQRLRGIEYHREDYTEAKRLAHTLDRELGLLADAELLVSREAPVDPKNSPDSLEQTWAHLSPDLFQTPYSELCDIVEHLHKLRPLGGSQWCELGAAYARLAFVLHAFDPEIGYQGFEIDAARVVRAQQALERYGISPSVLSRRNLLEVKASEFARFDVFFCFDLGLRSSMSAVMDQIRLSTQVRPRLITMIARGRQSRDVIDHEHPWLSQVHPPEHLDHFSIYRSGN